MTTISGLLGFDSILDRACIYICLGNTFEITNTIKTTKMM